VGLWMTVKHDFLYNNLVNIHGKVWSWPGIDKDIRESQPRPQKLLHAHQNFNFAFNFLVPDCEAGLVRMKNEV
jgi:hypothetical protein